ncbi:MAG: DUF3277 family protein [Lachnospiraceae bacterium]
MGDIFTYNCSKVKIALGTHAVTGYAEDSFVVIEPLDGGVTSKAGCDGEIVRSVDPNERVTVKITLLQSSPTHKFLLNKYKQDKKDGGGAFPILINDLTGKEKVSADSAWVAKLPSKTNGKDSQNKEWVLETGQAAMNLE